MRVLLFTLLFFYSANALAQSTSPLCAVETQPSHSSSYNPPIVRAWTQIDTLNGLVAADCTKWLPDHFTIDVALKGEFLYEGSRDGLLTRFGMISSQRGVRYWSTTDKSWQTLITGATAVHGPGREGRPDFTLDELKSGKDLYFAQKDNRSSKPIIYRMQIDAHVPKRLVIRTTNVSSLYFLLLPILKPGDIQAVYILEPLSPKMWGYFSLLGIRNNFGVGSGSQKASWTNRVIAMYSHFTGVLVDQMPPLVR